MLREKKGLQLGRKPTSKITVSVFQDMKSTLQIAIIIIFPCLLLETHTHTHACTHTHTHTLAELSVTACILVQDVY